VDLLVIKQGDKIAHQKGWTRPRRERTRKAAAAEKKEPKRRRRAAVYATQGSLFPDL